MSDARARELLAAEYDRSFDSRIKVEAGRIRSGEPPIRRGEKEAIRAINAAIQYTEARMGAAVRQEREECAMAVAQIESPFDHHTHTPEDCAYCDALDAAEQAIRARNEHKDGSI